MIGRQRTQTSQRVHTINIHRTTPTDPLSTTPSKRERWIDLILNANQCIKHHRSCLVQIQCIALHARLGGWLVGIPAVDVEGLDLALRLSGRLLDRASLGLRRDARTGVSRYGTDGCHGPLWHRKGRAHCWARGGKKP